MAIKIKLRHFYLSLCPIHPQIDLIQDNARFFLEVLSHKKSTRLEWLIIVLIAGELGLSIWDHL